MLYVESNGRNNAGGRHGFVGQAEVDFDVFAMGVNQVIDSAIDAVARNVVLFGNQVVQDMPAFWIV